MAASKPLTKTLRWFSTGKKPKTFSSASSSTVLEALSTNHDFEKTCETKAGMDVIIQRGKTHCPAISVNFPCCLLEDNELLEISFIKHKQNSHGPKPVKSDLHSKNPEELTIFLLKTKGRKGIQNVLMQNRSLKTKVDCVCVVAVKGETIKNALRRDGRFAKSIFAVDVALEDDHHNITDIKNFVNELKDDELYSIFRNSSDVMPDSLEMQNVQDDLDDQPQSNFKADTADPCQHSDSDSKIKNAQSSGKALSASDQNKMTTTTKSERRKYENVPKTEEILKILRAQFDGLVEQLKARENVKTPGKVQQLLREEFSKETQCFSQIKTVKTLMDLSASVCQVRHNNQASGTGFLLFGTCILTNAHVITDEGQLLDKLSVSFDFEDLSTARKQEFAIKKKPLAYEFKYTQQQTMDYAVLELETSAEALPPPLLKHYSAPPVRGGLCIIGHPAGGVKKMDMSLIIDRLKHEDAVNKHISDHPECVQVIREAYFRMTQGQIEYNSCFLHGASGSPVFDEFGKVIGMHSGGYGYNNENGSFNSIIEFAHPLLPILVSILRQTKDKRSDVWESFHAEKNTKQVVKLADDMTYRPESTNSCAWDSLTSDEEDMDDMTGKPKTKKRYFRYYHTSDEEDLDDMTGKPKTKKRYFRYYHTSDEEDLDDMTGKPKTTKRFAREPMYFPESDSSL